MLRISTELTSVVRIKDNWLRIRVFITNWKERTAEGKAYSSSEVYTLEIHQNKKNTISFHYSHI